MKKLILSLKKYPKAFIISSIVGVIIGFVVFCIFYFVLSKMTIVGAINGTSVAGAVLIATFGLVWLSRNGAFDTMSYGFKQMFTSMFNREANRYNNFAEYKEDKNAKREVASLSYFSFLAVSLLFFIAFAVLEIVYHIQY